MANSTNSRWSSGQFLGWGFGALIGTALPALAQIFVILYPPPWTAALQLAILVGTIALVSAFLGGALGYAFSYWFDEPSPPMTREFRSAFLFAAVVSMLVFSVLSFFSLNFIAGTSPMVTIPLYGVMSFISGFVAAGLKGVINNLNVERHSEEPPNTSFYKDKYPKNS